MHRLVFTKNADTAEPVYVEWDGESTLMKRVQRLGRIEHDIDLKGETVSIWSDCGCIQGYWTADDTQLSLEPLCWSKYGGFRGLAELADGRSVSFEILNQGFGSIAVRDDHGVFALLRAPYRTIVNLCIRKLHPIPLALLVGLMADLVADKGSGSYG